MIDEARFVAPHASVDHCPFIHREEQDVRMLRWPAGIAAVSFGGGDAFAEILDDTGTAADRTGGECTDALDLGGANFDRDIGHWHNSYAGGYAGEPFEAVNLPGRDRAAPQSQVGVAPARSGPRTHT